jgi:potassium efflux system protein
LGFGLQEIFANFVSGIILLFERPIRVGDVVTLADKTGVVSRIRMRATTIIDPDRKEYIVPNKDLVTGRLLNWTLTDFTNRIEIAVNVASGSDTDLACGLLLEAACEQSTILSEPAPSAAFEGFAENGLKLVLRCFLPNLDSRGATIHALHTAIDRKFRAARIEGPHGDMRIRLTRSVPATEIHTAAATSRAAAQVAGAKSSAA